MTEMALTIERNYMVNRTEAANDYEAYSMMNCHNHTKGAFVGRGVMSNPRLRIAKTVGSNLVGTLTQSHCIACGSEFDYPIISHTGRLCSSCANQGLFRKQIIITGITRMNNGHVCVSGVDPLTWRFVRPVFTYGLDRDFAMDGSTQVLRHFNLVEIEFKGYRPSEEYHTEDWLINENFSPRFIKHLTNQEIINVLDRTAIPDLNSVLEPKDKSLFTVKANRIVGIWHEQWEKFKVRMTFIDQAGNLFEGIPVTDLLTLAFVRYQVQNGNFNYNKELLRIFNNSPSRYIRIGLSREYKGIYWGQVTALITVPDLFNGSSFSDFEKEIGGHA